MDVNYPELYKQMLEVNEDEEKERNKALDIPGHLVCSISDELMEEPVMLTSGFTYEKAMIKEHFKHNGNIDPMTRESVDVKMLILN
jgi:hypothetical protein